MLAHYSPHYFRGSFEHCFNRGIIQSGSLPEWFNRKVQTLQVSHQIGTSPSEPTHADRSAEQQKRIKTATTLLRSNQGAPPSHFSTTQSKKHDGFKPYCPYYIKTEALSNAYANFPKFISTQQSAQADWIKKKKTLEVWRARPPDKCTVIKPCSTCGEPHLPVLHDIALTENVLTVLFPVWF